MKTNYNFPNNSNVISMDDIIFDGRNRAYGAYALRKNHHKYTNISFLFASSLAIAIFVLTLINRHLEPVTVCCTPDGPTVIINKTPPPPTVLPSPPAHVSQAMKKQIVYTVPVVVDIPDAKPSKELMTMEELIASMGSNKGLGGGIEGGTGTGEGSFPTAIPIDSIRWIVQEPAKFDGNFGEWIGKHLKYPREAEEMGVDGKVMVQFVINKEGKVENPIVTRGAHPDLDKEAIRVIVASSPYWTPGKQDGYPVNQFFNMTITFQVPKD